MEENKGIPDILILGLVLLQSGNNKCSYQKGEGDDTDRYFLSRDGETL